MFKNSSIKELFSYPQYFVQNAKMCYSFVDVTFFYIQCTKARQLNTFLLQ